MTALDDVLASITLDNLDDITAAVLNRVTEVRKTAELDDAALRSTIGTRVADLRTRATNAQSFADAQTARAGTVRGTTPAVTVAYLTLIRDELGLIRDDLAAVGANQVAALNAIADLATVVSNNL